MAPGRLPVELCARTNTNSSGSEEPSIVARMFRPWPTNVSQRTSARMRTGPSFSHSQSLSAGRIVDRAGPEIERSRGVEFQPQQLDGIRYALSRPDGRRRIEEEIGDDADRALAGDQLGDVRPGDVPVGVVDEGDLAGEVLAGIVLLALAGADIDELRLDPARRASRSTTRRRTSRPASKSTIGCCTGLTTAIFAPRGSQASGIVRSRTTVAPSSGISRLFDAKADVRSARRGPGWLRHDIRLEPGER